eukprot:1728389-Pleurochrysis_carterae.AAC.2
MERQPKPLPFWPNRLRELYAHAVCCAVLLLHGQFHQLCMQRCLRCLGRSRHVYQAYFGRCRASSSDAGRASSDVYCAFRQICVARFVTLHASRPPPPCSSPALSPPADLEHSGSASGATHDESQSTHSTAGRNARQPFHARRSHCVVEDNFPRRVLAGSVWEPRPLILFEVDVTGLGCA